MCHYIIHILYLPTPFIVISISNSSYVLVLGICTLRDLSSLYLPTERVGVCGLLDISLSRDANYPNPPLYLQ